MWMLLVRTVAGIAIMASASLAGAADWSVLKAPGTIALIRHADAPGVGDPKGWRLDDCSTQRNLSERGRQQARALGDAFRAKAIAPEKIVASEWCRTIETATLMQLGPVERQSAFNNAYVLYGQRADLTLAARQTLSGWNGEGLLVVVTHGDNIELLAGVMPSQGEIVAVRRDPGNPERLIVVGRIKAADATGRTGG
jgi:phosphohistidine phosphatase SixA